MLRLLLDAEAGQFTDAMECALIVAMVHDRTKSIVTLAHKLPLEDMCELLGCTCGKQFRKSYRHLLEYSVENKHIIHTRGIALYNVLASSACTDSFVKRESDENNYRLACLLLEYGADPDYCGKTDPSRQHLTTRQFASRHSDP
jgi:hypothetical protein